MTRERAVPSGPELTVPLGLLERLEAADAGPAAHAASGVRPGAEGARGLEARYRAYCREQAVGLLSLLPREAVRPLHRRALAWAGEEGRPHDPTEPLETLIAYCRHLLPLPPFRTWCEDLRRNPLAHAEALATAPGPEAAPARPATLGVRTVERGGNTWDAGLRAFADGDVWRGYVLFRSRATGRPARTAHVFREESPEEVRRRFMELAPATLEAFLRSSLP